MKMKTQILAILALGLLAGPIAAQAQYDFEQIDYPGAPDTQVFGISDRGDVPLKLSIRSSSRTELGLLGFRSPEVLGPALRNNTGGYGHSCIIGPFDGLSPEHRRSPFTVDSLTSKAA